MARTVFLKPLTPEARAAIGGDALRIMAAGDLRRAASLISTRSAEEEVEDEIRDLKDRQLGEGND